MERGIPRVHDLSSYLRYLTPWKVDVVPEIVTR